MPIRPPRPLQRVSRAVCDRIVACEERSAEADQGASSFAQRAEELFNKLAYEEVVSSEAAGLVVALAYLDLQVTEQTVVEATREILQPTENEFSKDAFLCFVKMVAAAAFCDKRQRAVLTRRE